MHAFKKVCAVLVSGIFMISLVGCGKKDEDSEKKGKKSKNDADVEDQADDENEDEDSDDKEGNSGSKDADRNGDSKDGNGGSEDADENGGSSGSKEVTMQDGAGDIQVGDVIIMGKYEQDGDTSNGPEDIKWLVLDVNGKGECLAIAMDALEGKAYHKTYQIEMTWEKCSLRSWLNDDFYISAFTEEEKGWINVTTVKTEDNENNGTAGGNDTEDKVFLLSVDEAEKYFDSDEKRQCLASEYAKAQGLEVGEYHTVEGCCYWWLRSPGDYASDVARVTEEGKVQASGTSIDRENSCGVRPAMWFSAEYSAENAAWTAPEKDPADFQNVAVRSMVEVWESAGCEVVPVSYADIGADKQKFVEGAYGVKDGQITNYVYKFVDSESVLEYINTVWIPQCEGYSLFELSVGLEFWFDGMYAGSETSDGLMVFMPVTEDQNVRANNVEVSAYSDAGVVATYEELAAKGFVFDDFTMNGVEGFIGYGKDDTKRHISVTCMKYASADEAVEKLRESYDSRMFQVFDVVDQADGSKTITIDADDMYYHMGPITGTISADGLVVLSHPDY